MRIKICINCKHWKPLVEVNQHVGLCQNKVEVALSDVAKGWHTTVGDMVTDLNDSCIHWITRD